MSQQEREKCPFCGSEIDEGTYEEVSIQNAVTHLVFEWIDAEAIADPKARLDRRDELERHISAVRKLSSHREQDNRASP